MKLLDWVKKRVIGSAVTTSRGWHAIIHEPFTGAFQRNKEERVDTLIQYPTLYACISRIATDIGKLPFIIKQKDGDGIYSIIENTAYSPVLRKPNHYQTAQQFRESWLTSKLLMGNTYVLKGRDGNGVVRYLYVLDPYKVRALVTETGEVYYQLNIDNLNQLASGKELIVPSSEIIHDRSFCPFHPLIGLPPIAAANFPAVKNMRILESSTSFFANNAQPSGILSAPGSISQEDVERLKEDWNAKFSGRNAGNVAVVGDGLKFEPLVAKSVDTQMIEQLKYSDEQICQPFGIPPFKIGIGSIPAGLSISDINLLYYTDALQSHIEAMENLLDIGLNVGNSLSIEMDITPLLRMDYDKLAEIESRLVAGAIKTPNEARKVFDLKPKIGGDAIYLQQQNYSLEALAKRDSTDDPFGNTSPNTEPTQEEVDQEELAKLLAMYIEKELK